MEQVWLTGGWPGLAGWEPVWLAGTLSKAMGPKLLRSLGDPKSTLKPLIKAKCSNLTGHGPDGKNGGGVSLPSSKTTFWGLL